MNCDKLLKSYLDAFARHSEIIPMKDGCILITPYLHSHGVYITIYAKAEGDRIVLHDNGETLQSLFMRGVRLFENEHREQLLRSICKAYSVDLSGWAIEKTVTTDLTGEGIIDLINALKSVNDMIYLHQASTSDVFKFQVTMFFKERQLNVTQNHKVNGKTTTHKIDFYYRRRQVDHFIKVMSGSQLQMKVIRAGFSYYDIRETKKEFSWINIINPEDEWSSSSLEILNGFSKVISWEHKDSLVKLLN